MLETTEIKPSDNATCVESSCCTDYVYVDEFKFSDGRFLSTRLYVTISLAGVGKCHTSVGVVDCVRA